MTAATQNLRCRALNCWARTLVIAHERTTSQMNPRQSQTWPLNFAACRLNRVKSSLIAKRKGVMGCAIFSARTCISRAWENLWQSKFSISGDVQGTDRRRG